jgi:hypothetical protein
MEKTKTQPTNPADVMSKPNSGTTGDHPDVCDALGNPSSHRQNQHEFDARERDVQKLHDAKRKQFGSNGYGGTN